MRRTFQTTAWIRRERLDRSLLALGRLDSIARLLPNPDLFLYSSVLKEAVLSTQIEGTQSSLSDLLLFEVAAAPGVPFDDVMEVSSYAAALERGLARIKDGFPLSNRLIRELHDVLMRRGRGSEKQPGEFRTSQNWLGGATPAQAVFVPLMLHVDGVLERPLLYLSLYFKQRREEYYARLERVRTEGDWEGWLAFFADGVIEVAENAVTAARRLADLVQHDRERVRGVGRGAPTALQIHEALQREPVTTIPRLVARTKLSVPGATAALQRLVALDLVREVTRRQRGRVYSYAPCVSLLSEGTEPLAR